MKNIQVFPNPNNGQFTLQGAAGNYAFVNELGEIVYEVNLAPGSSAVTITGLKSGVYIVRGTTMKGERITKKLIVVP